MAESKTTLEKIGLSRGKAALMGVLALALLGVIYRQHGSSEAIETAVSSTNTSQYTPPQPFGAPAMPPAEASVPAEASSQAGTVEFDQTKWQPPELQKVIAYDPFALPGAFPQPLRAVLDPSLAGEGGGASLAALAAQQLAEAVERMQSQLEELKLRGVHVIVNRNDEYVAVIGDRTIRVGDEINGFVVTAIESDGVRVEGKAMQ